MSVGTFLGHRPRTTLPVLATLATVGYLVALGAPAALLALNGPTAALAPAVAVIAIATTAAVFFSVALAVGAASALDGADASVAHGFARARRRMSVVAQWSAILTGALVVQAALGDLLGPAAGLPLALAAVAVSILTLMVVPVIAFESVGPVRAVSCSLAIFRHRWAEQLSGQAAIALAGYLVAVMPSATLVAIGTATGSAPAAVAFSAAAAIVIAVALVLQVGATLVFSVALYRYAVAAAWLSHPDGSGGGRGAELAHEDRSVLSRR